MGQSSSVENTENFKENDDQLHDNHITGHKKIDMKSCSNNIKESQEVDVTQSPIDSFFPIMNTAVIPSDCPKVMSSSIVETTSSLKGDLLKSNRKANNSTGLASKIIPKRPWTNYHLFPLPNTTSSINDSKARLVRSPKIQPKENKGSESNRNQTKFVDLPKYEANCNNENQLEKSPTQSSDIDQLITMMQNHKVSDDNSNLDFSRNTYVPSSEFQFSFPTTPNQYASPVILNEEEEYQDQLKYDTVNNRKILPLPKRRLKGNTNDMAKCFSSNEFSPSVSSIPSSPFTFSSYKIMPKASFLTDASKNMLLQQKQHTQNTSVLMSESENTVDVLINGRKDRPSMSKKMKGVEMTQVALINNETAATTGKRKETASGHVIDFKTPPKMEVFTNYTPPAKGDHFEFPDFNFKFVTDNASKSKSLKKSTKPRKNAKTNTLASVPAVDTNIKSTGNDTNPTNLPNKETIYGHNLISGKTAKDIKKSVNVKPLPITVRKSSNSTHLKKGKGKEYEKKKTSNNLNTGKTTKKNKKPKSKKEDIAPGGFLSSDITLFDNPISDEWICFFCQFDIFRHGMEDARKKNGYYRQKNDKQNRSNNTKKVISGADSSDDPFDDENRLHLHA